MLMPADDMWALLVWFRLNFDKALVPEKSFLALSHTTTDSMVRLCLKHGLGVVKTWVGFASLSAGVRDTWEKALVTGLYEGKENPRDALCHGFIYETANMNEDRVHNLAALEQSNGFSILGSPPPDRFSLGVNGHVRDKDGTFAGLLVADVAEWAKQNGMTIFEAIDKNIYLDPDIGLFVNHYEPDPLDGEYPGIKGDRLKKSILTKALELDRAAAGGDLKIGGVPVKSSVIYRTGKYDNIYPPGEDFQFPDEGVRFYFDRERLNHLTIRPSGTTNSLRFHVQLHYDVDESNLIDKKRELHSIAKGIADDIRELVGAPR
jgi:phosphomannomutase